LAGFDPAELDDAFASHRVVRAQLMRVTMHAVHAEDHQVFREAGRADAAAGMADAAAVRAAVARAGRRAVVVRLPGLCRGPARPVLADPDVSGLALQTLIRRYLEGFGPASIADMAQFAMVQRSRAKAAVQALGGSLGQLEGPDGTVLYDVPGALLPDGDTPAPPRLMAMWDSVLLAYADRTRFMPPAYRSIVTRTNGDVLPTLLVDGYVAGVWRAVPDGIEATAFHPLPGSVWEGLAAEARALVPLLADREPEVYARYHHW